MRVLTILVLVAVLLLVWDFADAKKNGRRGRQRNRERQQEELNEDENTGVANAKPKRNRNRNDDTNNDVENGRANKPKKNKNKNKKNKKRKNRGGRRNEDEDENTVDEAQVMGVPNAGRPRKQKPNRRPNAGAGNDNAAKKRKKQERKQARKEARKEARKQAKMEAKKQKKAQKQEMKKMKVLDFTDVTQANNLFAVNFYRQLAKPENAGKNIFFSPFSLTDALAMTALASRGETLSELQAVIPVPGLGTGSEVKKFHAMNAVLTGKKLKKKVGKKNAHFRLRVANKIYAKEGLEINPEYQRQVKKAFGTEVQQLDFKGNTEQSRTDINEWVEQKTGRMIKNLVPDGSLDPDTIAMIVNAIYFKAAWKHPFQARQTTPGDFFLNEGEDPANKVKAQFMQQVEYFNFISKEDKKAKLVELPYANDSLSMYIIVPTERFGLAQLESSLTVADIEMMIETMTRTKIQLRMPKFKAEKEYQAEDLLKAMGVTTLFTNGADLSGFTNSSNVKVGKIFHKTFIEVDERGTTAAGATGVSIMPMSMPMMLTIDEPFLFFIRHTETKAVIFLGRLSNPMAG